MSAVPEELVNRLDLTREVEIETRSAKGAQHSVIIWVVVVHGAPYVRSYLGKRGRWYRELLARKDGALVARGKRVRIRPAKVRSPEIIRAVSNAFRKKYRTSGSSLEAMVGRDVLDTTVRLKPVS
jgi:hypothetical protein